MEDHLDEGTSPYTEKFESTIHTTASEASEDKHKEDEGNSDNERVQGNERFVYREDNDEGDKGPGDRRDYSEEYILGAESIDSQSQLLSEGLISPTTDSMLKDRGSPIDENMFDIREDFIGMLEAKYGRKKEIKQSPNDGLEETGRRNKSDDRRSPAGTTKTVSSSSVFNSDEISEANKSTSETRFMRAWNHFDVDRKGKVYLAFRRVM
ncbi:hypothetical protein BDZ91DRAFT_3729 [Kalaharituber pfeilii]|nr:hypothetical protein BDZ91DRAFT_3729 [Kalaharituber pfeilii]